MALQFPLLRHSLRPRTTGPPPVFRGVAQALTAATVSRMNRLAEATSPYLLQHADNPVHWHEWGEAAFAEARREDKPILLSVGYSACHWCHVMAHESFQDPATADLMNRWFVNVKVDREERPDVDRVYMDAVQAMTGRGGWPMTVFLTPDGRPFYAGTYFPNEDRHGMPSFRKVLTAIHEAWVDRRNDVATQAERMLDAVRRTIPPAEDLPHTGTLRDAYEALAASYDPVRGGFGGAPKFPQAPTLEFLLRVAGAEWAPRAGDMLEHTLTAMARGGIHDRLGGGFARYAVDADWLVPHFEKMLYDNAQLGRLYLWAGIELGRDDFISVSRSTLGYLVRDLRHPDGGFFSSEDADSEGVEGKFYVWTPDEIEAVLGDGAGEVIGYYGVTGAGNFEGSNILNVVMEEPPDGLAAAKEALLRERSARIRPGLDDKVIASWNGLAIRAFAEAGAALDDTALIDAAETCARFCLQNLVLDGRLMRSWREGRTSVPGFLDDHASIAIGLFALYAATGDQQWYHQAIGLTERINGFTGPDGVLYSTFGTTRDLPKRPTDMTDNPLPSGNALAAEALLMAALYTGNHDYLERAETALGSVAALMSRHPSMVAHHLSVLHSSRRAKELAIVGPEWRELARVHWSGFRPHVALAGTDSGESPVPLLRDRFREGSTFAYLCEGFVCQLPTSDGDVLASQLA